MGQGERECKNSCGIQLESPVREPKSWVRKLKLAEVKRHGY